jgi:uncharacterized protein
MHRDAFSLVLFITAVLCAGVWSSPASAQSPAAIAAAREVVLLKADAVGTKSLSPNLIETVKEQLAAIHPDLIPELNEVALTLHREFDAKVSGELADQMARLYAASFTERELKDLLVFFKTPVGQKFLREEPPVISAFTAFLGRWSGIFSDTVEARFGTEMLKKGHPL